MASTKGTYMAKWTYRLTELFVSLMVDEVKKGNRMSCTYNKVGWNNIMGEFNRQTGLEFTLLQLKNKAHKLKQRYISFKKLLSQSGFGWDNERKMVIVKDESAWEAHIKANSDWAKFRKEGFPLYPELSIVFGDAYATGEFAIGNKPNVMAVEGAGDSMDADVGADVGDAQTFSQGQVDESDFRASPTPPPSSHKLDRIPNAKRRRDSSLYTFATTCKALQDMIYWKMAQSSTAGSVTSHAAGPQPSYPISATMKILDAMPDLEPELYVKAVNHACKHATWREAFLTCAADKRILLIRGIE